MFKRIIAIVFLFYIIGCETPQNNLMPWQDNEFDARFELNGGGMTGADGTYSVLLPDGRTVWIFGDSFLGTVTEELTREKTDPMYIRNCFVLDNGSELKTVHQGDPQDFLSMMIPPIVTNSNSRYNERDYWYWPGDGWVENNELKVFASEFFQNEPGMWGFKFKETALITFSLPDLEQKSIEHIPYSEELGIHYGHAVCKTDSAVYVYGLHEKKPHVARINPNNEWQFFNGEIWIDSASYSKPMADIDGSEQFSVFEYKGLFIMIMQEGALGKKVFSYLSNTPYGPWRKKTLLFETPIPYDNKNIFTYNALAHPQFIKDDALLVSYNTNSFELEDHFVNAGIYRPRFFRVPMQLILE